ncbi:MAG: Alpha/beta hydrolase family protein [Planctomycetaceae bacterium]|nr:Alpha/beta hydrolase family protein [Planctomycetaceae bacterium]
MGKWKRSFFLGMILSWPWMSRADDTDQENTPPSNRPNTSQKPNLKTQTLGGVQFWGDVKFFHGWHIQQNVFSKHYRLLDADDVRHAWGTREECEVKLQEIRAKQKLPPMSGTAVILLHGLGRSDKSVSRMQQHFEQAGYLTIAMNYPSLRANLEQNGDYLHQVMDSLEGVEKIHLVGFSLGGIVVRQCLSEYDAPKLGRVVFIGSPHNGAELATRFKDWWAFKAIAGPSGQELATAPFGVAPSLPAPSCEFGIIAGCRGLDEGYNPLIPGDDDGLVSLETTRLPGARDFMTVYTMHTMLILTPAVYDAAERFLEEGQFRKPGAGDRQPIPK